MTLRSVAGRKLVLTFHLQGAAPTARLISRAVRASYPSRDEVVVASVVDLSIEVGVAFDPKILVATPTSVPPVYWMTVALILNQACDQAATELPPDYDPAECVIILPDWGGFVSRKYGANNTGRAAAITVVNRDSSVPWRPYFSFSTPDTPGRNLVKRRPPIRLLTCGPWIRCRKARRPCG